MPKRTSRAKLSTATASTSSAIVRTEFAAAINQIANERQIPVESIYEAIRQALVSAYRRQYAPEDMEWYYFAQVDEATGESQIFRSPVTGRDEETGEITSWDDSIEEEVTPAGFGRIAAQTAKHVILQKIRESERDQMLTEYAEKIGELTTAQVLRMDGRTVVLDLGRGQGIMPPEEQMRGEFYRVNARIAVLIKEIGETPRGRAVILSRADRELVVKLFEREVPEVATGAVKIEMIAREAGVRTKLAVKSTQEGVDPVGACVGQRGARVQNVIQELNNEKLDIIPYVQQSHLLIQAALAPAEGLKVDVDENTRMATVTAPENQVSLAIGRGGQNARLAAKMTGYIIVVKNAEGDIASKATGKEEYEIDTFDGLSPEMRALLVEFKLTTLHDLLRFRDKWEAFEVDQAQKDLLAKRVDVFGKEMAERDAQLPKLSEEYRKRKPARPTDDTF
jgi:N utilization substance protein A